MRAVLYSGGLDSTVAVALSYKERAYTTPIYVNLGVPYAKYEMATILAGAYASETIILDAPVLAKKPSIEDVMVPGRNLLLAVIAAQHVLADEVWLSACLGERHEHAVDKNDEFMALASDVLTYVLEPYSHRACDVRTPFEHMSKMDVARMAKELGVDVSLTRSCLAPTEKPCGRCTACIRRYGIFKQLKLPLDDTMVPVQEQPEFGHYVDKMRTDPRYDESRQREVALWI
jgi:7-cyano-7-deazaguanine synthase